MICLNILENDFSLEGNTLFIDGFATLPSGGNLVLIDTNNSCSSYFVQETVGNISFVSIQAGNITS